MPPALAPEQGSASPDQASGELAVEPETSRTLQPPAQPAMTMTASAIPLPAVPALDPATAAATASAMTDDDLIEKEWVNKAKKIVEQTRDDPYKQSEDLTVFKSDYLKQRYGKTIKLSQ